LTFSLLQVKNRKYFDLKREYVWNDCEENKLNIFLAKSIIKGDKPMQKQKEKKQEKKKYTKMALTKHNKLKDITSGTITGSKLGCTKFLF
jgi:hypothetical protein